MMTPAQTAAAEICWVKTSTKLPAKVIMSDMKTMTAGLKRLAVNMAANRAHVKTPMKTCCKCVALEVKMVKRGRTLKKGDLMTNNGC